MQNAFSAYCASSLSVSAQRRELVQPLSAFAGESAGGTWTLTVTDGAAQDTGTLQDWQLLTVPALTGTCAICQAANPDPCSTCLLKEGTELVLTNETVTSAERYRATQSISAGPAFTVTSTGCAHFCAGARITLQPGFRMELGGRLVTAIE